jgi:hypothetical protein
MVDPNQLVSTVEFKPDFDPAALQWNEELGFMQVSPAGLAMTSLRLVGFAVPLQGLGSTEERVWPIIEYQDLPPEQRITDRLLKGVGPRLHNTLEAYSGNSDQPEKVGVYAVDIDPRPGYLLDLHANQGNRVARVVRHAWRLVHAARSGAEPVIKEIHASYGNADAVRMALPPRSELRQRRHGVINPSDVPPQFILIRNPNIALHKVGEVPALW